MAARNYIGVSIAINVPDFGSIESRLYKRIGKIMDKELDKIENTIKPTYRTWSSASKPEWQRKYRSLADAIEFTIFTESKPFLYVSGGTFGGRVTFSDDYKPKTRRRVLGSGKGAGRVLARGKGPKINTEAREFEFETAERREPHFIKAVEKVVNDELMKILTRGKRLTFVSSTGGLSRI